MRFVSLRTSQHGQAVGVVIAPDQVLNLSHPAIASRFPDGQWTLKRLIEEGLSDWSKRIAERPTPAEAVQPLSSAQLLAPIGRSNKVMGAAYNFTDALKEREMSPPAEPVVFFRSGSTVIGPTAPILIPPDVGNVGYEGELAVVIGRHAMSVKEEHAMGYVAGYMAHNDVSGSGLIKQDQGNFVRGKNLPASAPCGPWLATADEIDDPHDLSIELDIDGRPLQRGHTSTMLFKIPQLISWISHRVPLEPGDIIATGTPAGTAASHSPAAWLTPGQVVSVRVQGLGELRNPTEKGAAFLAN